MEKKELIYRKPNSKNRRILNVFITHSGMAAEKKLRKIFDYLDELCFRGFSEEEKIAAIKLLNSIQNNLDGEDNV